MKSIDSIEKFLEERLDPKRRTIEESMLKEHDNKKKQLHASKIFRVEFSESIPEETKSYLNEKLQKILDFPEKFGMNIHSKGHLLRFVELRWKFHDFEFILRICFDQHWFSSAQTYYIWV